MNICVVFLVCVATYLVGGVSGLQAPPTVVSEGGRDIHYFTTSGWIGLRKGVMVALGMPLALTCDFRDKLRRVAGPDGVMRLEVVTNTTSVNITFPSGAGQEVRHVSPLVNKFKESQDSYHPDATVFFPAVTAYTEVRCSASFVEAGKENISVIQISVTPFEDASVWRHFVDMKEASQVECEAYDLLVSRLDDYFKEMYDVVSLMVAGDAVITTIPRTAVFLPFKGEGLFPSGMPNETGVHLYADDEVEHDQITCIVYHVHRPDWGAYVKATPTKKKKGSLSWLAGLFLLIILLLTVANIALCVYIFDKRWLARKAALNTSLVI